MHDINWSKPNNKQVAKDGFSIIKYTPENVELKLHHNDYYEAVFVASGSSVIIIEGRSSIITECDIVLISPAEMFNFDGSSSKDFVAYSVRIAGKYIDSLSTKNTDLLTCFKKTCSSKCNILKSNTAYFKRFLSIIKLASDNKQVFGKDIMENVNISTLLVTLNRLTFENLANGIIEETLVDKIVSYVEANLEKPLSLDMIAKKFNISASRLTHFFKDETKVSLYNFITQKRLAKAKTLLVEGYSVKDAARASGFNDMSNFYRSFREAFNTTPKEYADMMK